MPIGVGLAGRDAALGIVDVFVAAPVSATDARDTWVTGDGHCSGVKVVKKINCNSLEKAKY